MVRKIILLILLLFVFGGLFFLGVNSFEIDHSYELVQGKNTVSFYGINPFYVEDLIKLNPDIEVVSYGNYDVSVGYINVFGGVGRNFVVSEGSYEIIVSRDISLILPNNE